VPRQPLDCKRDINSSGGVQSLYKAVCPFAGAGVVLGLITATAVSITGNLRGLLLHS